MIPCSFLIAINGLERNTAESSGYSCPVFFLGTLALSMLFVINIGNSIMAHQSIPVTDENLQPHFGARCGNIFSVSTRQSRHLMGAHLLTL